MNILAIIGISVGISLFMVFAYATDDNEFKDK